jgi:hypothetical protein
METATLSTTDVLEHLAAAERQIATVALEIAVLEASGSWAADGAVSFNAWLTPPRSAHARWGTQMATPRSVLASLPGDRSRRMHECVVR